MKVRDVPGCEGCLMYQTGEQGWVPDEVRPDALAWVYGQNPGAEEEKAGRPFVGATGKELERTFLPLPGLTRQQVSLGNGLRCRWNNSNDLPPEKILKPALAHCTAAHMKIPADAVVIAQGGLALRALTGDNKLKITEHRGYVLER